MTSQTLAPPIRTRRLSAPECRDWLASHAEGRLGYRSGCGDRAVVVNYSLAGDQVVFRVPEYSQVYGYAVGASVTLDVAAVMPDAVEESVTVTGEAQAADADALALTAALAEDWPPGVSTHLICLPMTSLTGTVGPL